MHSGTLYERGFSQIILKSHGCAWVPPRVFLGLHSHHLFIPVSMNLGSAGLLQSLTDLQFICHYSVYKSECAPLCATAHKWRSDCKASAMGIGDQTHGIRFALKAVYRVQCRVTRAAQTLSRKIKQSKANKQKAFTY